MREAMIATKLGIILDDKVDLTKDYKPEVFFDPPNETILKTIWHRDISAAKFIMQEVSECLHIKSNEIEFELNRCINIKIVCVFSLFRAL